MEDLLKTAQLDPEEIQIVVNTLEKLHLPNLAALKLSPLKMGDLTEVKAALHEKAFQRLVVVLEKVTSLHSQRDYLIPTPKRQTRTGSKPKVNSPKRRRKEPEPVADASLVSSTEPLSGLKARLNNLNDQQVKTLGKQLKLTFKASRPGQAVLKRDRQDAILEYYAEDQTRVAIVLSLIEDIERVAE